MDASKARGAFPQGVQDLIAKDGFKIHAANGIQYFVTIGSGSTITKYGHQALYRSPLPLGDPTGRRGLGTHSLRHMFARG
jgi:hypothetical protein